MEVHSCYGVFVNNVTLGVCTDFLYDSINTCHIGTPIQMIKVRGNLSRKWEIKLIKHIDLPYSIRCGSCLLHIVTGF